MGNNGPRGNYIGDLLSQKAVKTSGLLRHSSTYIPRTLQTRCKPGLDGKDMLSLSHVPAYAILKTRMWYVACLCKILLRYVCHLPMVVSFSTIVINYTFN